MQLLKKSKDFRVHNGMDDGQKKSREDVQQWILEQLDKMLFR